MYNTFHLVITPLAYYINYMVLKLRFSFIIMRELTLFSPLLWKFRKILDSTTVMRNYKVISHLNTWLFFKFTPTLP